jgi:hypothetical protein
MKKHNKIIIISATMFLFSLISHSVSAQSELSVSSVSASSYYSSYTASKAIDNSLSTYWRGASYKTYWWLKLDLGETASLTQISLWWHKDYGSTNYNIQVSANGTTWTNAYTALSSSGGGVNPYQKDYSLSGSYRYLRIYINKAQKTYPIIYEVKIYGSLPDTTAPTGSIEINNGAQYAGSTAVTLNLSAADSESGLNQMQFSNDGSNWSGPEPYATEKTWTLTSGGGVKTVYVKYSDMVGNWSEPFSDSITLDNTPPVIFINPVTSPTNQNVFLSYGVSDNFTPVNEITVSGNNSPYISEGTHSVTITAQDSAGNSASTEVDFTIDKTPPVIVITSPQEGTVVEDAEIQLLGTVDGIDFSETRTLTEGENTLTKNATDAAGNTASVSVKVYLYSGQLIGPEGGEVISPDGRVKIIIPQGALTEARRIKILTVSNQNLQGAIPGGRSLLSAVECKPYGLTFNQPVSIVYTLYSAEVPGTPVELGLYDAGTGEIVPTGQTTTVPSDGYNVEFFITHFSTYAALKNLISQSTPIGSAVKIPLPDMLTGSFGHAIPITVPPGRKGMQPALALAYRSSGTNSWVGQGFSLNPGYIVRSTRLGPPSYIDTQDTFYFITDAGTTELVNLIDNLYQAKIESGFTKFFKESDDSWRAVGKDGSVLRFGQSSDSKETSFQGTFSWYLTKAVDTNGNYIEYQYVQDQGKSYLSRINYTGNEMGISAANYVEFTLESRDDISCSYISSSKILTAKRLKEIQVKQNYDLVWRYVLEYEYSPDTSRSLLKSVTQYASDNKNLPIQTLSYQSAE